MNVAGGGFEQCDNGQRAVVDMDRLLIVATDTVQACNDKQQVHPMLTQLDPRPDERGNPVNRIADTGYFSEATVTAWGDPKITPLIAVQREAHHLDLLARFADPPPLPKDVTEVARMRHALLTMAGRALYAKRKCTVAPVIGIVKSVMRFRHFSRRGLAHVTGELKLVAMAWNVKRMCVLAGSLSAAPA
jgi:Transposase DDE domain